MMVYNINTSVIYARVLIFLNIKIRTTSYIIIYTSRYIFCNFNYILGKLFGTEVGAYIAGILLEAKCAVFEFCSAWLISLIHRDAPPIVLPNLSYVQKDNDYALFSISGHSCAALQLHNCTTQREP